jgi:hypothetical protein
VPTSLPTRLLRGRAVKVAAMALLIGSALHANLDYLANLWSVHPAPNDEMARRDRRFEPLRSALPTRGTLGYVSDAGDGADLKTRLMLAEFALAPLILVPGANQDTIVGDLVDADAVTVARELHLTVIRDFGNGVVLFARPRR